MIDVTVSGMSIIVLSTAAAASTFGLRRSDAPFR
jgi:hypothetical protein